MPAITLNAKKAREFSEFAKKHDLSEFFVAKDSGAYIGMTAGSKDEGTFESLIHYFRGCDPSKDEECYENSSYKFGGDDFGVHMGTEFLHKCAAHPKLKNFKVDVGARSIKCKAALHA